MGTYMCMHIQAGGMYLHQHIKICHLHYLTASSHMWRLYPLDMTQTIAHTTTPTHTHTHNKKFTDVLFNRVKIFQLIHLSHTQWQHSLRDLDLSWNLYPGMSLDCAMHKLSDDPAKSALEVLNLSGTSITSDRVKLVYD